MVVADHLPNIDTLRGLLDVTSLLIWLKLSNTVDERFYSGMMGPEEKASIIIAQTQGDRLVDWLDETIELNGAHRTYKAWLYTPWLVQVANVLVDLAECEKVEEVKGKEWEKEITKFREEMEKAMRPVTLKHLRGAAKRDGELDWTGEEFEVTVRRPTLTADSKETGVTDEDHEGLVQDWDMILEDSEEEASKVSAVHLHMGEGDERYGRVEHGTYADEASELSEEESEHGK